MKEENTDIQVKPFKPSSPTNRLSFKAEWEYAEAPESTDHISIEDRYGLFIDGKFIEPEKGRYFKSINPANDEVLAEIAEATQQDVNKAVEAARNAYEKTWSKLEAKERGKYIFRIARLIQERAREFSVIET